MKARVKETGHVIDVELSHYMGDVAWYITKCNASYSENQIEFIDTPQDYWTRLEHQYAGMAMQAYIIAAHISQFSFCEGDMKDCKSIAHALVEEMKEERK